MGAMHRQPLIEYSPLDIRVPTRTGLESCLKCCAPIVAMMLRYKSRLSSEYLFSLLSVPCRESLMYNLDYTRCLA